MTRHAVSILSLVLLLLALATMPASAVSVGFDPADQAIGLGSFTSVDIQVSDLGGEIVSAYDLDILYDSSIVMATDVVFTTSLGDELVLEVFGDFDLATPGVVDLAQLSLLSDDDLFALQGGDSVVVASVEFEAVGVGTSPLVFTLDNVNDVKGRLGQILPVGATGGQIRVERPGPVIPEPSSAILFAVGLAVTAHFLRRGPRGRVAERGRARSLSTLVPLVLFLGVSAGVAPSNAQICSAPVVPVLSQFSADNFACSQVTGNLFISGSVTDLAGLSILTSVGGDLVVQDTAALVSLTGLGNLSSVGGNLEIGNLLFGGNGALVSLSGLEGLASVGGDLSILDNDTLVSLTALAGMSSVGGGLSVIDNAALVSLTGLLGLGPPLAGGLVIRDNAMLASLTGLENLASIDLGLVIDGNASLASMVGLDGLASIGGQLSITDNPSLTSLDGLESLASIGATGEGSFIADNPALASLAGLTALTTIGGNLTLRDTQALVSLAGLENLTSARGLVLSNHAALTSLAGLDGLTDIQTLVVAGNPALTSLAGAGNVTSLVDLSVAGNDALPSLAGLENLVSLGSLAINGNAVLTSLAALSNLTSLDGILDILFTPSLQSLDGLENITSVGNVLEIIGNDALVSLAGLDGLTSVGAAAFVSSNPALQSLAGLENLTSVQQLGVFLNDALVDCACGLSGLIGGSPPEFAGVGGLVEIFGNEPGGSCTSPPVVLAVPQSSCTPSPLVCDVDGNGVVDQGDVQVIFDSRGDPASGPDDPRDSNRDGIITVNDGRECVLQCTLPNCQPACGLIGVEPLLLLGYQRWRRRRRGTG